MQHSHHENILCNTALQNYQKNMLCNTAYKTITKTCYVTQPHKAIKKTLCNTTLKNCQKKTCYVTQPNKTITKKMLCNTALQNHNKNMSEVNIAMKCNNHDARPSRGAKRRRNEMRNKQEQNKCHGKKRHKVTTTYEPMTTS